MMQSTARQEYTLAALARVTAAPRRSVQHWAEAGAIRARRETERRGTGTHRLFSRDEAIIACIVHAFAKQQLPIGGLIMVSKAVRGWLGGARAQVESAIAGKKQWYLVYQKSDADQGIQIIDDRPDPRWVSFPRGAIADKGGFAAVISLNAYLEGLR